MIARWLLAVIVASLLSAWGGYERGHRVGSLTVQAQHDRTALDNINRAIRTQQDLIDASNAAHQKLVRGAAERVRLNERTTKELRDALELTAALRAAAECRYGDDVMQHISAARDRAARAAAGGFDESVPDSTTGTGRQP